MYNAYRESWLVDRYAATVAQAFGHRPCVDLIAGGTNGVIVAAVDAADQDCSTIHPGSRPLTRALAAGDRTTAPAPVSDDRPFPYLLTPSIPSQYLLVLLGILLVSLAAVGFSGGRPGRLRPYADLALLGAAFLLLETRGVTRFALLFGTTWLVNALVFAGVLVGVLVAVEITRRLPRPPSRVTSYALLAVSLLVTAFVPSSALLQLPVAARLVAAVAVTFAPIIAANIVFAARFAGTADATAAFGANLLGAMVVVDHAVRPRLPGVGSVQAAKAAVTRSSRPADAAASAARWRVARAAAIRPALICARSRRPSRSACSSARSLSEPGVRAKASSACSSSETAAS